MRDALVAVLVGASFGGICRVIEVPLPAPAHINGILAIIGLYVGYMVRSWL